ncbi:MAG: tol-pal system-associated acyl-CoA thioesterase [Alphaproteobacteria bacterium]|nr:tol-pal system-associated acyl-CoA thioesterase [Alphaproteobacteria bacterium]
MNDIIKPASGTLKEGVFFYPVRIYYEDTDAGGIVYYANYLKFSERARTEFLRFLGINQQQTIQETHCGFVVRSCNIDYMASAVLDDELEISCKIRELGAAYAVLHQEIFRGEELLSSLDVKVIYMNIDTHRPTRIPENFVQKFKKMSA